jgi:ring-1,2-phenylacetyl-CoA epoxidase subunit PaaB
MSDTQWPRFEVFQQESPDRPHRHAGSVHAPDSEMALLNARDVFVRRPECSSLWVAPEAAITSGTAEQPETTALPADAAGPPMEFLIFAKLEAKGTLTHIGQVVAGSAAEALEAARRAAAPRVPFVVWVVPSTEVVASEVGEADPLFAPARDKPYRDQAFYHVQSELRRLRREQGN